MTHREWRNVLLLALAVAAITTAPYLLAWSRQGDNWRFSGSLFGVEDGNSYLGKLRLGARGEWNFSLFYTTEAHDSAPLIFLPYILPGQIVGHFVADTDPALTPALILTFHLMRIVFDTLLIVVIYRFAAAFLSRPRDRLIATVLALFGGGLGWLLSLTGQPQLPADFYIPEGFSFLILFGLPHLALARAALLGGLLALMHSLPNNVGVGAHGGAPLQPPSKMDKHSPLPEVGEGLGVGWKYLLLAAVCWLIVGLCVSFYLAILYCILGAWGLAAWVKQRHFPTALFVRAIIPAAITLPLFLYYTLAFTRNPAFAEWSAQNLLASPPPLQYVWAYLPLGLLAIFGVRRLWTGAGLKPAPTNVPAASLLSVDTGEYAPHPEFGEGSGVGWHFSPLLIGWVLIVPILLYLPINVQRRMSEAVIVPLAIFAAVGLRALYERGIPRVVLGAWVGVTLLTSALLLLGGSLAAASPARPLFRPAAEIAAFNWLDQHSQPGEIVLSAVETGNVIPAWTHLRVYMGHGPETLNWQFKTARLEYFYSDSMSAAERADFFAHPCGITFTCAGSIRYVIWGPLERALAPDDDPAWAASLTPIYDADGYVIYSTSS